MKYLKDILIVALAVTALAVGIFALKGSPKLSSYSPINAGGFITQTNPLGANTLTAVTVVGNVTNCGTSGYFTTTSTQTLTPAQFLSVCNDLITGTGGNVTTTFPAATSTWVAAGSPAFSGYQWQIITNDSTNTATFVPGTGMTFRCETQGVGTTTVVGTCTSAGVTINPTSTALVLGYWDNSSSSFVAIWGNEYH